MFSIVMLSRVLWKYPLDSHEMEYEQFWYTLLQLPHEWNDSISNYAFSVEDGIVEFLMTESLLTRTFAAPYIGTPVIRSLY
jgi:hypothetical protein